jgi:hypothetical protein
MRRILFALAALAFAAPAVATEAVTTRIEPRPYYGAVVTIEQGVRVWRPLPPHDRIIINPDNRAAIFIDDHRFRRHRSRD